jgi:hypothetical protein
MEHWIRHGWRSLLKLHLLCYSSISSGELKFMQWNHFNQFYKQKFFSYCYFQVGSDKYIFNLYVPRKTRENVTHCILYMYVTVCLYARHAQMHTGLYVFPGCSRTESHIEVNTKCKMLMRFLDQKFMLYPIVFAVSLILCSTTEKLV